MSESYELKDNDLLGEHKLRATQLHMTRDDVLQVPQNNDRHNDTQHNKHCERYAGEDIESLQPNRAEEQDREHECSLRAAFLRSLHVLPHADTLREARKTSLNTEMQAIQQCVSIATVMNQTWSRALATLCRLQKTTRVSRLTREKSLAVQLFEKEHSQILSNTSSPTDTSSTSIYSSIAIIGYGFIGKEVVRALLNSGIQAKMIMVVTHDSKEESSFSTSGVIRCRSIKLVGKQCRLVFLCVLPHRVKSLSERCRGYLHSSSIIVSTMSCTPLRKLQQMFGTQIIYTTLTIHWNSDVERHITTMGLQFADMQEKSLMVSLPHHAEAQHEIYRLMKIGCEQFEEQQRNVLMQILDESGENKVCTNIIESLKNHDNINNE